MTDREQLLEVLLECVYSLHTFYWEEDNPRENPLSFEIGACCEVMGLIKEIDRKKADAKKVIDCLPKKKRGAK